MDTVKCKLRGTKNVIFVSQTSLGPKYYILGDYGHISDLLIACLLHISLKIFCDNRANIGPKIPAIVIFVSQIAPSGLVQNKSDKLRFRDHPSQICC